MKRREIDGSVTVLYPRIDEGVIQCLPSHLRADAQVCANGPQLLRDVEDEVVELKKSVEEIKVTRV